MSASPPMRTWDMSCSADPLLKYQPPIGWTSPWTASPLFYISRSHPRSRSRVVIGLFQFFSACKYATLPSPLSVARRRSDGEQFILHMHCLSRYSKSNSGMRLFIMRISPALNLTCTISNRHGMFKRYGGCGDVETRVCLALPRTSVIGGLNRNVSKFK